MKQNFCVLSIIFAFVILAVNQTVNAQSDNLKPYSNKEMNFSIQYPLNWKVNDFSQFYPEVSFRIPDRDYYGDDLRRFEIGFEITTVKVDSYLDTDTMTLKNTSLEQRVQQELNSIQSDYEKKLIRQNEVTVGGNTAWKVEYTRQPYYYSFDIFTIDDGKFYRLSYTDEQLKVPETLPLANKMVESFQIKTNNEDTSNNSDFDKENEDMSNNLSFEEFEKKYPVPESLKQVNEKNQELLNK